MKRIIIISMLLSLALLFTACDMNTLRKLEAEEQAKIEARVKTDSRGLLEVTGFETTNEGFQDGKTKYVINYRVKTNKAIPLYAQGIPWVLEFEKKDRNWVCTKNKEQLASGLLGSGESGSIPGLGDPFDLKGLMNQLDQAGLEYTAMSDEEENELGGELQKQLEEEHGVGSFSRMNVARVFRKITAEAARKKLAWQCTVTQSDDFNAFAVPGGKTFLHPGLLSQMEREGELAFVIAHEVAHNDLKHCVQRVQHAYRASQIDPMLGEVVAVAYGLYKHPFSQDDEFAADKRGVQLMTAAGYDKEDAISFFRKLQKYDPAIGNPALEAINDFIGTHPSSEERIRRIEKM